MGTVFCKRFRALSEKGKGGFGVIYEGEHIETHSRVAIKVESVHTCGPLLANEYAMYQMLDGCFGFPKLFGFDNSTDSNALVIQLLGPSLDDMVAACGGALSVKTVLLLANEMINRIEYVHRKCYVHRDIKPSNFLLGENNTLYMIDFGVSGRYCDVNTHIHIPMRRGKQLVGTDTYASINAHQGVELSRRDDLESLAYVLVYLLKGVLPWQGIAKTKEYDQILQMKKGLSPRELCVGLPPEFEEFLLDVRQIGFSDEPDYSRYRAMFRKRLLDDGYTFDFDYDWSGRSLAPCQKQREVDNDGDLGRSRKPRELRKRLLSSKPPLDLPTVFLLEQLDESDRIAIPSRPVLT